MGVRREILFMTEGERTPEVICLNCVSYLEAARVQSVHCLA